MARWRPLINLIFVGTLGLFLTWSQPASATLIRPDSVMQGFEHLLVRPPVAEHIDSASLPLRVHFEAGVSPEYAQTILETAEAAWTRMFIEMGFLAPLPDYGEGGSNSFDVYIVSTLQPGIGGYTSFSGFNDETPWADAYGFAVFAHDLKPRYLRGVVAHELFHASQMAYDWWEDMAFMEASSTWIVDHVFDDENLYWKYYSYYNRQPWKALDFISLADPYQYGSGMFLQFLDEHFGSGDGSFVKSIWEGCVQNDYENEPDYFDSIDLLLKQRGSSFDQAFHEFGKWRIFVGPRDDGKHFAEGGEWGPEMAVPFEGDVSWPPANGDSKGELKHPLQPYSHAFFRVTANASGVAKSRELASSFFPTELLLTTAASTRLQVSWVLRRERDTLCSGASAIQAGGGKFELLKGCNNLLESVGDLSGVELLIYVSNLADGFYDTESPVWTESPVAWEIH